MIAAAGWALASLTTDTAMAQERGLCIAGTPGALPIYVDSSTPDVIVVTTEGTRLGAAKDLLLCPGDEVQTGATGRAAIRFDQKRTVIRLDGNSRTRIMKGGLGTGDVNLLSGVLYFVSSVRRQFQVDTPYIVAGIEGTEALVAVEPRQRLALTTVRGGIVSAYEPARGRRTALTVAPGEAAFRSAGTPLRRAPIEDLPAPFRGLLIASDSAVDWAVYYPPILLARGAKSAAVRDAAILLSSGDYDRALARLGAARGAAPAALRAIIAVGRNRLDEAERWSRLALEADPDFAPAHVAASYVRQAEGELEGALEFARAAVELAPKDAYALARLAELLMTIGDRPAALAWAERSIRLKPTPLALFVAGLARLAASQYETAEDLFRRAIARDPQAPLPRLGLGLLFIRRGDIAAGTWELERAVAHDPRRAALRTWLGRGYFEEGLAAKAAEQFDLAIGEDPEDPTPYLFSALERYAANQPIPALRQLEKADLGGDARRVLRSERGLAEDAATRGAGLGRLYDVLGFDQLAISAGTAAVDADPANPGAHRFLADVYRARRDYEFAQTSELLQSQLLSPPSKTPVQPELAEADLTLLDTTGPSRVTFAEFAPLYDSDGIRFDASGLGGTQDTWGDQVAATILYRNASLSVGQFHYETDGYRENNDLRHDIFNAVSTIALTPELSLFGELRYRETEGGERRINFDIAPTDPTSRLMLEKQVARFGFHAQLSSKSDLIGVYTWANLSETDTTSLNDIIAIGEDDSHSGQLQHIWQSNNVRNISGGSYTFDHVESTSDSLAFPGGFFLNRDQYDASYWSGYTYFYLEAPKRVTWTLGGSVVSYKEDRLNGIDVEEVLPKLGVRAELTDNLTFRATYLQNVKPRLVSEQLLEPTSVAGFNQFFDAYNGSRLEQVGGAIDLKLGDRVTLGGEAILRWWRLQGGPGVDFRADEEVYRGYAYVTLSDQWALAAEVIHEHSKSNVLFDFKDWNTTSIPLTLSYFSESGLFGSAGPVFVDHDFRELFFGGGSDTFTLVNATIGYRFPDGRGVVSVEAQNLFDEEFHFQNRALRLDFDAAPRFAPSLTILARATVRF